MKSDPTIWLVARAAGIVAYALLTASVLAGLVLKTRPFGRRLKGVTAMEIHRTLATLGLGALVLHAVALVLDSAVNITLADLVIPGSSPYRPLWTAFGVIAAELMVLVMISFPLRKRIGIRVWRKLHYTTYAIFWTATVHGITAGTDSGRPWARWLYVGALGAVAAATAARILAAHTQKVAASPKTAVPSSPAGRRSEPASPREVAADSR